MSTTHAKRRITLWGEWFEADVAMVPLLEALSAVGIRATQHCVDRDGTAYLYIDRDSLTSVEEIDAGDGMRLVLRWPSPIKHQEPRKPYCCCLW